MDFGSLFTNFKIAEQSQILCLHLNKAFQIIKLKKNLNEMDCSATFCVVEWDLSL